MKKWLKRHITCFHWFWLPPAQTFFCNEICKRLWTFQKARPILFWLLVIKLEWHRLTWNIIKVEFYRTKRMDFFTKNQIKLHEERSQLQNVWKLACLLFDGIHRISNHVSNEVFQFQMLSKMEKSTSRLRTSLKTTTATMVDARKRLWYASSMKLFNKREIYICTADERYPSGLRFTLC